MMLSDRSCSDRLDTHLTRGRFLQLKSRCCSTPRDPSHKVPVTDPVSGSSGCRVA